MQRTILKSNQSPYIINVDLIPYRDIGAQQHAVYYAIWGVMFSIVEFLYADVYIRKISTGNANKACSSHFSSSACIVPYCLMFNLDQ